MIARIPRTAALGLGALLLATASVATAQHAERPAERLSRYLRELSADPTSLSALIGAGQAALDVGDGNAALGFFARADERSPRNGQIKAGLARALLQVDNPREALKMFDAARSLGVPDAQLAGDRGLAYDLRGDNRRAQQDYVLALGRGANDEVTKRYALSLGITGDRDEALKLLDPLLYKRDQGAWRARAFVLAMTGDTRGASAIVHQVMPQRMAQTMDPFLLKLAALTPAQKAAAVHLGEMPSNVRFAAATVAPQPVATPTPAARDSREPRRRPGAAPIASPPPRRAAPSPTPTPSPSPAPAPVQIASVEPVTVMQSTPASVRIDNPPAALPATQRGDLDAIMSDIRAGLVASAPSPSPTPARVTQAAPRQAQPVRTAQVAPKPTPTPTPAANVKDPAKPDPKATKPDPKAVKAAAAAKKKPEPPKNPARIWVQVAGGANANALPREWASISGKAAELKGKGPWTAKNRATNRLLAGPYKSETEAQAAVSRLRKAGIGAFQWSSDEGEAVDRLGAK